MSTKSYTDIDDLRGQHYLDTRDLAEALTDYDEEIDPEGINEDDPELRASIVEEYGDWAEEIRGLESEIGEWQYGETLIREDYFVEYARQFAEDIGAVKDDLGWPYGSIDWEKAADDLRMDYSSVEFGGFTYYVRS